MSTRTPKANGKPSAKPKPPATPPQPPEDHGPIPDLARDALGGFADEWLNTPNLHLDLKTPLQAAAEGGAWEQIARDILLAYKYGIFG